MMKSKRQNASKEQPVIHADEVSASVAKDEAHEILAGTAKPTSAFTQSLAREIVKNLAAFGTITTRTFKRATQKKPKTQSSAHSEPILVDTSVLIDGRIVPVINSGFVSGTLLIPEFVLAEVQHIADSQDAVRRAKGRRGLEVVSKLKSQKTNVRVKTKVIKENPETVKEVDHKLAALAKQWKGRLLTNDFNLAQLARAQSIKVLSINDLAQALKVALVPGEELTIRISHEGKDRDQGVGYLDDGTMVVVDNAKHTVGHEVRVIITKVHQTQAGQLFFARLLG